MFLENDVYILRKRSVALFCEMLDCFKDIFIDGYADFFF